MIPPVLNWDLGGRGLQDLPRKAQTIFPLLSATTATPGAAPGRLPPALLKTSPGGAWQFLHIPKHRSISTDLMGIIFFCVFFWGKKKQQNNPAGMPWCRARCCVTLPRTMPVQTKRHKGPTATRVAHRGTELEAVTPSKPVSERVSLLLDTFFGGCVCLCGCSRVHCGRRCLRQGLPAPALKPRAAGIGEGAPCGGDLGSDLPRLSLQFPPPRRLQSACLASQG